MSDVTLAHLDVAARWFLHHAFEATTGEAWERFFPEVGEHDLERIMDYAEVLLPEDVSLDEWKATCDYFAHRATPGDIK